MDATLTAKALNRDVIVCVCVCVCVREIEQKLGLFRSIFVDETSYDELISLARTSIILPIPENSRRFVHGIIPMMSRVSPATAPSNFQPGLQPCKKLLELIRNTKYPAC